MARCEVVLVQADEGKGSHTPSISDSSPPPSATNDFFACREFHYVSDR